MRCRSARGPGRNGDGSHGAFREPGAASVRRAVPRPVVGCTPISIERLMPSPAAAPPGRRTLVRRDDPSLRSAAR
ncbi:hypothetical protein SCATT_46960 [Streptantibioticus cattleyicolor NRRL 8057 = DSM 46488]|uniref:Uncharacterized protein n=1 Tax=Streptantibioticus cattleyicolor (strain ATCC 35852 / DSM 46488 / JCM 4925 / NBRC 14057 / NRRL 8057) TaxID=1003195 RepID=G8WT44_STREN|nr:hypothetical protein SCATT_46960 [Streptantibioticus cattleyicolor NRRL 8057 = DSM 46488]